MYIELYSYMCSSGKESIDIPTKNSLAEKSKASIANSYERQKLGYTLY